MSREKSAADIARTFVRAHHGRRCFAPFTGQDHRAFAAFAHLLDLYCGSDTQGRAAAVAAMREVLSAPQQKCLPLFKAAIPALMDWSDEERVWLLVGGDDAARAALRLRLAQIDDAVQKRRSAAGLPTLRLVEPGLPELLGGCTCVGGLPPMADCPVHDPREADHG